MTSDRRRQHRRTTRLQGHDYASAGAYFVTICTHRRACLFGEILGGEMRLNDAGKIVAEEWMRTAILRPGIVVDPNEFIIMPNHVHGIVRICATQSPLRGKGDQQVAPVQTNGCRGDLPVALPEDASKNRRVITTPPDPLRSRGDQQVAPVQTNGCRGDLLVALPEDASKNRRVITNPPDPLRGKGDQQVAPTPDEMGAPDPQIVLPDATTNAAIGPRPRSMGAIMAGFKAATTTRVSVLRGTPRVPVWQRNYHEHIVRNDIELASIKAYIRDNPQRWGFDRENPSVNADPLDEPWAWMP